MSKKEGIHSMARTNSKYTKHIIDTAVSLFKEHGYQSVSVNEICKAADIPRSTFYTVFSSKNDIINYVVSTKGLDQADAFHDFVNCKNDFERMWRLCTHYLDLAENFGPTLLGLLLNIEMDDPLGIYEGVHSIDHWLIQLMQNCQNAGIIRCPAPAEVMIPITDSLVFQLIYDWCRCKGAFSIHKNARFYLETVLDVAPQYRWEEE